MSKYNTINEFVAALVNNDRVEFHDSYGRRWKFEDSCFWFSDLGQEEFTEGLFASHLYGTEIRAVFGDTMSIGDGDNQTIQALKDALREALTMIDAIENSDLEFGLPDVDGVNWWVAAGNFQAKRAELLGESK